MFEDRCHERGMACASCARAMSEYASFDALRDHLLDSGFDGSYFATVRGMWVLSRKRKKERRATATSTSTRPSGVSKKTSRPDDRLKKIAKAYGVEMKATSSRTSVVRACLKKSHPDKKAAADYTETDRANHAYLVRELKGGVGV
eukprot:jgi/Tetstr1/463966/TSEL_008771.t1